jgi:Na+:H+ antiporter, NhaA family
VHPTLTGVAFGLLAPSAAAGSDPEADAATGSVVERLEHTIHPWSSFVIVPIFALANTGIEISASGLREAFGRSLTWAVIAGLVVGKPLGVFLGITVAERTRLGERPAGVRQRTVLGIGNAAGIGFTVAIFVAELAFDDPQQQQDAKLAILTASVVSAVLALVVLRTPRRRTS